MYDCAAARPLLSLCLQVLDLLMGIFGMQDEGGTTVLNVPAYREAMHQRTTMWSKKVGGFSER